MRRLLSLLVGLGLGISSAIAFVTLFSPVSGEELRENLKDYYEGAKDAARSASEAKRKALEEELAQMQAE